MSGNSLEEKRRIVDALREKHDQLSRALGKIADEQVSSEGKTTLREHKEEIQRLKHENCMNPEDWSPEKEARLQALVHTPRYVNELIPILRQCIRAFCRYSDALEDLKREEQAACSEAAAVTDEHADPTTADFCENKPLLGAYSTGFNNNLSGRSVRQRVISHHRGDNGAAG